MPQHLLWVLYENAREAPLHIVLLVLVTTAVSTLAFVRPPGVPPINQWAVIANAESQIYAALFTLAPVPRPPLPSEKTYITTATNGSTRSPRPLPCWHDEWLAQRKQTEKYTGAIDEAEIEMSVVIPAYNEEQRIDIMLEEAVAFLDREYGRAPKGKAKEKPNGHAGKSKSGLLGGYEILIVNDGSKDKTVDVALAFARRNGLHDVLRICTLEQNRGKGGAVTHGLRHVRGAYAMFADADGASKFEDLAKLVKGCDQVADGHHRGIAVGSRAHMVGSEAVIKVCEVD